MNRRTKVSTAVSILMFLNFLFIMLSDFISQNVDVAVLEAHPKLKLIYGIITILGTFCAWFNSHYFNQDFTEEMCEATGYGRWLKMIRKGQTFGDGLNQIDEGVENEDEDI